MAHYAWNEGVPLGAKLRQGLEELRSARHKLLDVLATLNQMSSAQITAAFAFSDGVQSASTTFADDAKNELSSDVSNLAVGSAPGNAIQQMLDQFA